MEISLLVGLKNNLSYSRYFYTTTRELYPEIEIVFVSYGSNDGTHEWLDGLDDPHLKYYYEARPKTLSDTYNKCIELATKKYVAFLHNDMVLAPGFAEGLLADTGGGDLVFYRVVEPPVFAGDQHAWKLVQDFGSGLEDFNRTAFLEYAAQLPQEQRFVSADPFFFLCTARKALIRIGGLDPIFNPMFCEDNDLLYRLELLGLTAYQSCNALAYHFVSKTSRFSPEFSERTTRIEMQSRRNFYRKWGFGPHAAVREKRNYGLILKNPEFQLLQALEPLVDRIYTDADIEAYITTVQPATDIDLRKKFLPASWLPAEDILIYFDGARFNTANLRIFENLSTQIQKILNSSWFRFKKYLFWSKTRKIGDLRIRINQIKTYERNLIIRK
ncbi:hypothetical protein GCM10027051_03540 [Niabella terrae]